MLTGFVSHLHIFLCCNFSTKGQQTKFSSNLTNNDDDDDVVDDSNKDDGGIMISHNT